MIDPSQARSVEAVDMWIGSITYGIAGDDIIVKGEA